MRIAILSCLLSGSLLASAPYAQTIPAGGDPGIPPAPASTTPDALISELKLQADAWDKAIVRKDLAAIRGNMAEDFRQIASNGQVADRETFLAIVTAANLVIDPYTVEELEVRVYGDVALVSGRTRMTGRYDGTPFSSHYRYIDIYVRRYGKWRVASVQITPIPPA